MSVTREHYDLLSHLWTKVFIAKKGFSRKTEIDRFWRSNKDNPDIIHDKIKELKKIQENRQRSTKDFFKNSYTVTRVAPEPDDASILDLSAVSTEVQPQISTTVIKAPSKPKKSQETREQDKCKAEIARLNAEACALQIIKNTGLATDAQLKSFQNNGIAVKKEKARLHHLELLQARQQKLRLKVKTKFEIMKQTEPEMYDKVSTFTSLRPGTRGRPCLEADQPDLLKAIVDIVSTGAATDDRRRSEMLRTCRTLDDLHTELERQGFTLSRSSVYLRLLPRKAGTREALRHVRTVPVKLIRASNDGRNSHVDSHFCAASIKYVKDLAELIGEQSVFVLSQDDKARVPMALPAATQQAPILMNMEYRVRLPDHDYPVAPNHKFIPSVYAGIVFDSNHQLSYSGPTYIAIRSAMHDSSTSVSHGIDFRRLLGLPNFKEATLDPAGNPKPVVIIFTDGGPDENPRFEGTLRQMALHFKILNLDAIIVATHAPGQSAYNQVERRMAPLSRDLAGVILPHDSFGTHLNNTKTINKELERQNFDKAGTVLAEIWNGKIIDNFEVFAEYIQPGSGGTSDELEFLDPKWIALHVQQSQYMLQIMKCGNELCCAKPKTNIRRILQGGYIPGPLPFIQSETGINVCNKATSETGNFRDLSTRLALKHFEGSIDSFKVLPFDYFCPSLTHSVLEKRVCKLCNVYFPRISDMGPHIRALHPKKVSTIESYMETIERVIQEAAGEVEQQDVDIEVIADLNEFLAGEFIDIVD